ncbi:hypothetical protein ABFS82_10G118900 [Erythranthe guttata]
MMGANRLANMSYLKHQLTGEEGTGDEIYEVVDRVTGVKYFLKEFRRSSGGIEILMKLEHPNLLKCVEVIEIKGKIYLLYEHMDGGSLSGDCIFGEFKLAGVARQVLLGLRYLHRNNICHGDVRLSNIFIDSNAQVKVLYSGEKAPVGGGGGFWWWDVWNLGLSILKLCNGLNEFPKSPPTELLYRFLSSCMKTHKDDESKNRWAVEKLLCHPFLNQLSATTSFNQKMKLPAAVIHEASPSEEITEQINLRAKRRKAYQEHGIEEEEDVESSQVPLIDYWNCIRHLALFLPDYGFSKDKLVQMWIAEECIKLEVTKRMEDVGNLCFDFLLNQNIIVPSKPTAAYLSHYQVNDKSKIARLIIQRGDYVRIRDGNELDTTNQEILHLTWDCRKHDHALVDDALTKFKKLRTLLVVNLCIPRNKMCNLRFPHLKLLKTLDLSSSNITHVPCSIEYLESLRFLDISNTPIDQLPQSIDLLLSLQTLRLRDCPGIHELPWGFGSLINLRHLDLQIFGQLRVMPSGMGNLTKLQTLDAFIVGETDDGCGITELKNMNEIAGSFSILKLHNVSNAEEAKAAALCDKKHIDDLYLYWGSVENPDATDILEYLQPHFNLKFLHISHYCGSKLPSWITNPSFVDLSTIFLIGCINCDTLPSFGELPSLKSLDFVEMTSVRDINSLFCRKSETRVKVAFPKLEKLSIDDMPNLVEWSGMEDGDFPCLKDVTIGSCPELATLPSLSHLRSLESLEINDCEKMISLPELPASVKDLRVRCCPKMSKRLYYKDGRREIAHVNNIWIDLEKLSLH